MSLAKVSGGDFSRAFLNQVEFGRVQPSTRVLRVIAVRLGTDVNYLLEGREPAVERELALEKARVLLARGDARKALLALQPVLDSTEWPLGTDARLCQVEALVALDRLEEAAAVGERVKALISARSDRHRLERLRAIRRGERFGFGGDAVKTHLQLADRAQRAANNRDALEHYRAARVLLEVSATPRSGR
jgi:transcriptional regulator with XRE-family HTH domain